MKFNLTDFALIANCLILFGNIIVLYMISQEESLKFKTARIILLITVTLGTLVNFGKLTWLTAIFTFIPFLALTKFKKNDTGQHV